ncbi:uncharacterized protein LY79DRAFT_224933 [Colletotrichum navitas]|uniref:Uncharacterized protein n=1 Tax=Colletotrichum navitas TaxID=681940 RepID=A0AAD8PZ33_9PEZI|nr:uncharacterized protein LY79DRAFT_224933 [Colletotrichum navitas]KAK1590213.1 hypothetical protein LY79DRAFT_224933 [Colletotrichum navitas]
MSEPQGRGSRRWAGGVLTQRQVCRRLVIARRRCRISAGKEQFYSYCSASVHGVACRILLWRGLGLAQDVNHLKCVVGLAAVRDAKATLCVRMILDRTWTGRDNIARVGKCTLQYAVGEPALADLVAYHLLLPGVSRWRGHACRTDGTRRMTTETST